jgi:A/G-specific adenine glycosylase
MLQQTQVERVEPKYFEFLEAFPDWEALANAGAGQVLRLWAPLGYNGRAVRLLRLAQWVVANGGKLPSDEAALQKLPGVGSYTAAALASFAFGQKSAVIDTNVRRVVGRALTGEPFPKPVSDKRIRPIAASLIPEEKPGEWHQALMDLGALVCTTRRPRCHECPVGEMCLARARISETSREPLSPQEKFEGSRRFYRGRFLAALRDLEEGEAMRLEDLGYRLRQDYGPEHGEWLRELTKRLVADGLVRYEVDEGMVGLP